MGGEAAAEGAAGVQVITEVTLTFRVWGFRVEPTSPWNLRVEL